MRGRFSIYIPTQASLEHHSLGGKKMAFRFLGFLSSTSVSGDSLWDCLRHVTSWVLMGEKPLLGPVTVAKSGFTQLLVFAVLVRCRHTWPSGRSKEVIS